MKKNIQIALLVVGVIAIGRAAYIFYERYAERNAQTHNAAPPLDADYYVIPKKLRPYDLKSAQQLTEQPVWAKIGYAYTFYPYDAARHSVNFAHEAGLLLPIEELQIKEVITAAAPHAPGRQVMAVFEKDGKSYAFSIGTVSGDNYQFYSDDMLYVQDPHQLYQHWPAEIWEAIGRHEVKPGMNELQVTFAVGLGIPEGSGNSGDKTVDYANGGKPLSLTYRGGKVAQIRTGS
jgi:hypothetical protein